VQYGRSDAEWTEWACATRFFLVERTKLKRLTSYTEVNTAVARRIGHAELDFSRDLDRAAMGHVLGLVSTESADEGGVMLSALVIYLNENDAGTGFYGLASDLGLLPRNASLDQKLDFWQAQVQGAFARYG
jgi:hypothetical protein